MIPSGSTIYTDNVRYQHQFGTDPMIIVFTGDRGRLLSGHNLHELRVLQRRLAASGEYHAVLGPLTAVRFAAAATWRAPSSRAGVGRVDLGTLHCSVAPSDMRRAISIWSIVEGTPQPGS